MKNGIKGENKFQNKLKERWNNFYVKWDDFKSRSKYLKEISLKCHKI